MQSHRRQPTRLHRPWDSPGKNTGVGCHFLLQCMKVKSESEVTQSCPTLHDPMDCSLPGSSVHGRFSRQEYWSGVPLPSLMYPFRTSLIKFTDDKILVSSVQFSSVAQSCLTLCNPMNCSTLGLPVHHQLPEFTQIHAHLVSDAIQPSHPLLSPSPPGPNPSQHQSLFQ